MSSNDKEGENARTGGKKNQFQCQGAEGFKEMKQITTAIFFFKLEFTNINEKIDSGQVYQKLWNPSE